MQPYVTENISIECSLEYNETIELVKFIPQAIYLMFGIAVNSIILWTMFYKYRTYYLNNSFYIVFGMDCAANLYLLALDLMWFRLLIYVTPLCKILMPYLCSPRVLMQFTYTTYSYVRGAKSVIQIYLVVNRLSCVYWPVKYHLIWSRFLTSCITSIFVLPVGVIWNVMISRVFVIHLFGGIAFDYKKRFTWASLSMFQTFYLTVAIVFTAICSLITLFLILMIRMPKRMKSSEKSLCIATIFISLGFISAALFQFYFAFINYWDYQIFLALQYLTFDYLNITSPLIVVKNSSLLKKHIFHKQRTESKIFMNGESKIADNSMQR